MMHGCSMDVMGPWGGGVGGVGILSLRLRMTRFEELWWSGGMGRCDSRSARITVPDYYILPPQITPHRYFRVCASVGQRVLIDARAFGKNFSKLSTTCGLDSSDSLIWLQVSRFVFSTILASSSGYGEGAVLG